MAPVHTELGATLLSSTGREDARLRAALLAYLSAKLQPLYCARSVAADLPGWVARLPLQALVDCLRVDPRATADALAVAIGGGDGADLEADLRFLISVEYARLPLARQLRLARFTVTVRECAVSGDGTARASDLYAEGFSSSEVHELMPRASHLLKLLARNGGGAARLPEHDAGPAGRLAAFGARAAAAARPTAAHA